MRRAWTYSALCGVFGALAAWPTARVETLAPIETLAWSDIDRIRPGVDDLELRRRGTLWVTWPDGQPANPYAIRSLAEALAEPLILTAAEAAPPTLEPFGLGATALHAEWSAGARVERLKVGRSLTRYQSFVQVADEDAVRIAPINLRRVLAREREDWLELRLFPTQPPALNELARVDGGRAAWRLRRSGATWAFAERSWRADEEVVERAIAAILQSRATRYAGPAETAAFRAISVFEGKSAEGQFTLALGQPGPDGRWARRDDGPVLWLPASSVGLFDLAAVALRARGLWRFEPDHVVEWELIAPTAPPTHLRRSGDRWVGVTGEGPAWDAPKVHAWLAQVAALEAAGFADARAVGAPSGRLRLRLAGDRWLQLELGEVQGAGGRRARVGDRPEETLVLSASSAARLLSGP